MKPTHTASSRSAHVPAGSQPTSPPRALTVEAAAEILGVSRSTMYECVRTGEIASVRIRRRIVIPASVIDDLIPPPTTHAAPRIRSVHHMVRPKA